MTSIVALEINSPLEAIINLRYLLNNRVKEDETAREYIESAESEPQGISRIAKQTLRWSNESVQKPQARTAGYLFKDILQLFAGKIKPGGQRSDRRWTRALVYGALGQVSQVLANLVANAIQAVPVRGEIKLSAREDGDMTEIKVWDNGQV